MANVVIKHGRMHGVNRYGREELLRSKERKPRAQVGIKCETINMRKVDQAGLHQGTSLVDRRSSTNESRGRPARKVHGAFIICWISVA
jgi:hypothetical protein